MNKNKNDILLLLSQHKIKSQREISDILGLSLGLVNKLLNELIQEKYINSDYSLTDESKEILSANKPKNAIILAAGFGTRMVPINLNTPKALLEIKGEPLIERLIKQLIEVGIDNICVVVGFMKEKFEYLIDKYNIKIIVNPYYIEKNNIYSLYLSRHFLKNCYVVPSDLWCDVNPFRRFELYSWYMLSDELKNNTGFTYLKNGDVSIRNSNIQNNVIGISYITKTDSEFITQKLEEYAFHPLHSNDFWETTLYKKNKLIIKGRLVDQKHYF